MKTVLIDLDGVLNTYSGRYDPNFIPEPHKEAKDFLRKLCTKYTLILFTSRPSELAKKWLDTYGLNIYFKEVTSVKKPAYAYIDDRCLNFKGSYEDILHQLQNFEPYWRDI